MITTGINQIKSTCSKIKTTQICIFLAVENLIFKATRTWRIALPPNFNLIYMDSTVEMIKTDNSFFGQRLNKTVDKCHQMVFVFLAHLS